MKSGAYAKFVEIHSDARSGQEAHQTCMFLYWHRLLLMAFENMLRSQGSQFACVTIPYFNWISANDLRVTGKCTNFLECSSILTDFAGVSGIGPLQAYERGVWSQEVPDGTSLASVYSQVFVSQDGSSSLGIADVCKMVEGGGHATVHSELGGAMGLIPSSPADPIFWSHHAMVDALHAIFYGCRGSSSAWQQCYRKDKITPFTTGDEVGMFLNSGRTLAWQDLVVGKFFTGVPRKYGLLADVRGLGYIYSFGKQLSKLYNSCDSADVTRRHLEERQSNSSSYGSDTYDSTSESTIVFSDVKTNSPSTQYDIANFDLSDNCTESGEMMLNWYDNVTAAMGGRCPGVIADLERQMCMYRSECLGGTPDFAPEFKAHWNASEPRCRGIVNAIKRGEQKIEFAQWRETIQSFFGCPNPSNSSASDDSSEHDESASTSDVSVLLDSQNTSSSSNSSVVGGSLGGGIVVLLVLVAVGLFVASRRKQRKQNEAEPEIINSVMSPKANFSQVSSPESRRV